MNRKCLSSNYFGQSIEFETRKTTTTIFGKGIVIQHRVKWTPRSSSEIDIAILYPCIDIYLFVQNNKIAHTKKLIANNTNKTVAFFCCCCCFFIRRWNSIRKCVHAYYEFECIYIYVDNFLFHCNKTILLFFSPLSKLHGNKKYPTDTEKTTADNNHHNLLIFFIWVV